MKLSLSLIKYILIFSQYLPPPYSPLPPPLPLREGSFFIKGKGDIGDSF
jgi:hypothetical protein